MTYDNAVERAPIDALQPYKANPRTHSKKQIQKIANSIKAFGWTNPILVDDKGEVIAGHGRLAAARELGFKEVPILRLSHLSEAQKRAYVIADNRLAEQAGWDKQMLALELQGLIDLQFDVELTGFVSCEIDLILEEAASDADAKPNSADESPPRADTATTTLGDLWILGEHTLLCADACRAESYAQLMQDERADTVFTDPPYNVPIAGHVTTGNRHREFVMASGEMSSAQFECFLKDALTNAAGASRNGAIAFVCMDWRHIREVTAAGAAAFSELKQLCVWAKTNGGMGTFYRSQHELVFVFKVGDGPHTNTFELGQYGRYRTNLWTYPGANSFKAERDDELSMHSTVKPTALVEDAIKDVSKRGDLILDPFGGSGTTLIAAHKCGRRARLIELDPGYCDVIVQRFERFTGKTALLHATGQSFAEISAARLLSKEARNV
jgi:DNA modification methylase